MNRNIIFVLLVLLCSAGSYAFVDGTVYGQYLDFENNVTNLGTTLTFTVNEIGYTADAVNNNAALYSNQTSSRLSASSRIFAALSTNPFLVSFWLKTTNISTANQSNIFVGLNNGGLNDMYVRLSNTGTIQLRNSTAGATLIMNSTTAVNDGRWHHVVITRPAILSGTENTTYLYVDGVLESSALTNKNLSNINTGASYIFGDGAANNAAYPAYMDRFIANKSYWNASTVLDEYNSGLLFVTVRKESDGTTITGSNVSLTGSSTYTINNITGYCIARVMNNTAVVSVAASGFSSRQYSVVTDGVNNSFLATYLPISGSPTVVLVAYDSRTHDKLFNGSVVMYRVINGTSTIVESHTIDISGSVLFNYEPYVTYSFVATSPGYLQNSFTLSPIIYSSYDLYLNPNSSSAGSNYSDVTVDYAPTRFFLNNTYNEIIRFSSANGTLLTYNTTIAWPGGAGVFSGTNALGETFNQTFLITNASFSDRVNISYCYTTSTGAGTCAFTGYSIGGILGPGTMASLKDNTYGLGLLERLLIVTLLAIISFAIIATVGGATAGGVTAMLLFSMAIVTGFLSLWFFVIPLFLLFFLVARGAST
jgi:hypothetical protein